MHIGLCICMVHTYCKHAYSSCMLRIVHVFCLPACLSVCLSIFHMTQNVRMFTFRTVRLDRCVSPSNELQVIHTFQQVFNFTAQHIQLVWALSTACDLQTPANPLFPVVYAQCKETRGTQSSESNSFKRMQCIRTYLCMYAFFLAI